LALQLILKRLKHSPIVAIQGARQTGKSFLVKEPLKARLPHAQALSLDRLSEQQLAQSSPQTFLARFEKARPLIIDEAQKAPALFDAIKFVVDLNRVPGSFLLLGSTEFSHLQNIRESLTGRMGRVRLFPMVARELFGEITRAPELTRSQMLTYASAGGMPGIAFVRDRQARSDLFQDWVDLTCSRDVHQFKRLKLDSNLAFTVFKLCATLPEPSQPNIARAAGVDGRRVATHLKALGELFAVVKLDPHPSGKGKPIYLPLDAGIAEFLGADLKRRLHVLAMNERMAHNAYFGTKRSRFYFYRSTGKNLIHLIEEHADGKLEAVQIFESERIKKPDLELLKAFVAKNQKARGTLLAPVSTPWKEAGIAIMSWESLAL
jgi:predicted AAA+ superfamily ATPase